MHLLLLLFLSIIWATTCNLKDSQYENVVQYEGFLKKNPLYNSICEVVALNKDNLMETVLNVANRYNKKRSSVHFITSITSDISSYASFAMGINLMYIISKGYTISLHFYDKHGLDNRSKHLNNTMLDNDARWNKVLYFIDELELQDPSVQWYVWIDADLSIIDFKFSFESLLKQIEIESFPLDYHVIMSKDKATAQFVANTGCIIVKNSLWSLEFFHLWWHTYDRSNCCDQNALTWLYYRQLPSNIQERMLFLPADKINTNFPCYLHHQPNNAILHLAGFSSVYRIRLFQHALNDLCLTVNSSLLIDSSNDKVYYSRPLSPQLTLNLSTIQQELVHLHTHRRASLQILLQQLQNDTFFDAVKDNSSSTQVQQQLLRYHQQLEDIMKFEDDEKEFLQQYHLRHWNTLSQYHDIEYELSRLIRQLRLTLYQQLLAVSQKINLNATHCMIASGTSSPGNSESKEQSEKLVNQVSLHCKEQLEVFKDVISVGIEFVITSINTASLQLQRTSEWSSSNNSNNLDCFNDLLQSILILQEIQRVLETVLKSFPAVNIVQAKFSYYAFKHHQFMSQLLGIVQKYEDALLSVDNMTQKPVILSMSHEMIELFEKLPSDRDQPSAQHSKTTLMQQYIYWLNQAKQAWEFTVQQYQYYGTNYVLADPEKEYILVILELGVAYCSNHEREQGLSILLTAIEQQKKMIDGYHVLQITTKDIVHKSYIFLSEIQFNAGYCAYQKVVENDHFLSEAVQHYRKLSKSLFMDSQQVLYSRNAQTDSKAYELSIFYLERLSQLEHKYGANRDFTVEKLELYDQSHISKVVDENILDSTKQGTVKKLKKRKKVKIN